MKRGTTIYYWDSASYCVPVTFIKWIRTRRHCGGPNTNKIGTGILARNFVFGNLEILRPYWEVYRTHHDGWCRRRPVKRPDPKELPTQRATKRCYQLSA